MILSDKGMRRHEGMIVPFCERTEHNGLTYGVGAASYDCRIDATIILLPGKFCLAATIERFAMPDDIAAVVHDKSSWARRGLTVQNTFIDPGFRGYLTLELTNHSDNVMSVEAEDAICQLVFHYVDGPAENPYRGKYQDQLAGAQPAIIRP